MRFFNFIQQKLPASISGVMNVIQYLIQCGSKPLLNKVKASGGFLRFSEAVFRVSSKKSGRKYAKAHLMIWFMIPLMVFGLVLSSTTPIYAGASAVLYSNASSNTYKAYFLTDIEKIIQEVMEKRQNMVVIQYKGSTDQLLDVISGYISKTIENDEYLNYSYRSVNMAYKAYGTDITITLKFTYYETAAEMKYVDEQVKAILSRIIKPEMNNHEQVKAIHDYLVLNLGYDTNLISNSPYTALAEGITACNGYAMLAYKMLKELDFEVRLISGVASSQTYNPQNHAWNLVKLDGKWYHLDVTWDDPVPDEAGRVFYDYYLLSDKEISKNHSWKQGGINGEEKPYPASTTSYSDLLQGKISTTNEAERYQELMESIGLQYLLPEFTSSRLIVLSEMIGNQFSNYKKEFSLRYIDQNGDLSQNLRKIIYDNAVKNNVKSWSFLTIPYIRGTTPFDQLVVVSDIVYQNAPPMDRSDVGIKYPTPGYKSMGSFANVVNNKVWTIQFDEEVSPLTFSKDNIYIIDSKGKKLDSIDLSLKDTNHLLIANKYSYNPGETYYLYVKNKIKSVGGVPLNDSVSIKFQIEK